MSIIQAAKDKRILIFDFDGTIALIGVDWKYYFSKIREYFNAKDANLLEEASHYEDFNEVESLYFEKHGMEARLELREITLPIEMDMRSFEPNPEVIDFIKSQHKNFDAFYIWSSNHEETIVTVLRELKLLKYFKYIVSKDTVIHLKPNAEGFKHIFDGLQYRKSEYLFIGNSKHADGGAASSIDLDFYHEKYFP